MAKPQNAPRDWAAIIGTIIFFLLCLYVSVGYWMDYIYTASSTFDTMPSYTGTCISIDTVYHSGVKYGPSYTTYDFFMDNNCLYSIHDDHMIEAGYSEKEADTLEGKTITIYYRPLYRITPSLPLSYPIYFITDSNGHTITAPPNHSTGTLVFALLSSVIVIILVLYYPLRYYFRKKREAQRKKERAARRERRAAARARQAAKKAKKAAERAE